MLKDRELTDLVNYVLGLPLRKNGRGVILRDPISPCVIQAISKKRKLRLMNWGELMLCNAGVLPKTRKNQNSGRRANCPPEIQRFVVYEFSAKKKPHSDFGQWDPDGSLRS